MNKETATLLEQHFDTAFAAPDGIAKLRELILTLAMQGKLVEQDPNDSPASELLKEIETEKQRLVKAGKIKKPKALPPIKTEEVPYELPQGWKWVRLGTVAEVNGGFAFKSSKYSNDGVRVIRISDFDESCFKNDKIVRYPYSDNLSIFSLEANNILMAMTGGTVGKNLLVKSLPEQMVVNQRVATIKMATGVVPEFINGLIRTDLIQAVIQKAKNSTNDNISMGDRKGFFVPLPPLPEQHRIVTRIDQLMARCDELEKLRKEQEEKRLAVHAAAIRGLLDASHGSAWDFIGQHFSELYTVKENVAELRKAILQLAVMGRLVPQDPNDPPAGELLKEIQAEKQRLIKEKKIKKPKPLPPVKPKDLPYALPQGWEWVRLGEILIFGPKNGYSPTAVDYETPVRSLTLSATTSGTFKGEYSKYIDEHIEEDSLLWLEEEDMLVQRGNTIEYVGVSAVFHGENNTYIYPDLMMKLRVASGLSVDYVHKMLSSEFSRNFMRSHASGTSSTMPKISQVVVNSVPFALPSIPEQQRIVARTDQLMALCDILKQQIDAATGKQTELLNALMAQV